MKRLLVIPLALLAAACGQRAPSVLQGYGEADYVYIASQEAGVVGELFVREGDHVDAGQAVFTLDRERLSLNAQSASAQAAAAAQAVRTAQADAALAQSNLERGQELFDRGFYPQARLDSDRASRDAANARLAQARREANAAGAQTNLARTRVSDLSVSAPRAGAIERIYYRPGEVIAAGAPVAALLGSELVSPALELSELSSAQAVRAPRVRTLAQPRAAVVRATRLSATGDFNCDPFDRRCQERGARRRGDCNPDRCRLCVVL